MLLGSRFCFLSLPHCPSPVSHLSTCSEWIVPWCYPCSPCIPTVQPVRSDESAYLIMSLSFLKLFRWFPILIKTKLSQQGPVDVTIASFSKLSFIIVPSHSVIQTHCLLSTQQTQFVPAHLRTFARAVPASWNAPLLFSMPSCHFLIRPFPLLPVPVLRGHSPYTFLQGTKLRLIILVIGISWIRY